MRERIMLRALPPRARIGWMAKGCYGGMADFCALLDLGTSGCKDRADETESKRKTISAERHEYE